MSKLTDIKRKIDELDGGAFQNLCDAYLACKGYGNGYSLGMHTGTDKTAKGNPDTYFLKDDNNYVFTMYTMAILKNTKIFSEYLNLYVSISDGYGNWLSLLFNVDFCVSVTLHFSFTLLCAENVLNCFDVFFQITF